MGKAAELVWKNAREFRVEMDRKVRVMESAAKIAAKVEGFRLRKELIAQIKAGSVGGSRFAPLSEIAKKLKRRDKPILPVHRVIRYRSYKKGHRFGMLVGVVDPGKGAKISRSWVRLSYIHQESFSTPVTEELREKLRNKAIFTSKSGRIKRRKTGWAKYFFLKKSTKYLKTPARPFIEPLMRVNRAEIENNLKTNYLRKLAGEQI